MRPNIAPVFTQLPSRPEVSVSVLPNGSYSYSIKIGTGTIRGTIIQDHVPAVSGTQLMSETEATSLANFIADKIYAGLPWSVSTTQVDAILSGSQTSQQLIDKEKSDAMDAYTAALAVYSK